MVLKNKYYTILSLLLLLLVLLGCSSRGGGGAGDDLGPLLPKTRAAVSTHGQLQVIGTQLCDASGDPIWLRGMSSHGLQWYGNCINATSLDVLINEWKCDVIRLSLYAREDGYEESPSYFTSMVEGMIDLVVARDAYVIIDWHQLSPGDPWADHTNAVTYLTHMATTYGHLPNIIYEICNEPNNCSWNDVKTYAEDMIPRIRAIDPDGVIIVGTHGYGSLGISDGQTEQVIINDPVNATNIMYSFHFYAASHGSSYRSAVQRFAAKLPLIVTEFGTQDYSGDGANDFISTDLYLDMFEDMKISWVNWNFSYDHRSGAVLQSYGNYTDLKEAGVYVKNRILNGVE